MAIYTRIQISDLEETCNYYVVFDLGRGGLGLCRTSGKIDLHEPRELIKGDEQIGSWNFRKEILNNYLLNMVLLLLLIGFFGKLNIHSPHPELRNKH